MTIKPVLSQKSGKHDKKDIQDQQQQQISGPNGGRQQRITPKSPSPQREQKTQNRSTGGGGGGGSSGSGVGTVTYDVSGRRNNRSNAHIRNKRENVVVTRSGERGEKKISSACKSPSLYQQNVGDCSLNASCSSKLNNHGGGSSNNNINGIIAIGTGGNGTGGCGNIINSSSCSSGTGSNSNNIGIINNNNNNNVNNNVNNNNNNNINVNDERLLDDAALSGYNSGDEHIGQKDNSLTLDEWTHRDETFQKLMTTERRFIVKEIGEDGACLFRSISLQIYGDEDMHEVIRQQTMDYIYKNREYFAQFVTEDINAYVKRKRENHVHGNHIEIQAISEIYNRAVELYCYKAEPINIFNADQLKNGYEPFRLSYQRGSHYNAILNPYKPCVGVGLGLAGYRPDEPDLKQMRDAVRLSEDLEIEQTMFEDKLKTTDWEATNEVIEEQIARESYLQWCRDNMQRDPQSTSTSSTSSSSSSMIHQNKSMNMNASSSTITSSDLSGNKSPNNCSGGDSSFESEDYTPYPSDNEEQQQKHCDFGESSSTLSQQSSGGGGGLQMKKSTDTGNTIYYMTQQQRQRRRKRRRGCTNSSVAGPSSYSTPTIDTIDYKHHHLPSKMIKLRRRSIIIDDKSSEKCNEMAAGTSKQNFINNDKPMSAFYHSLLESSYTKENSEIVGNQLTEDEMIRKALAMSRMDFVQKLRGDPADPPSP